MFRWMLSFMRQIEEEATIRIEKQRKLTEYINQADNPRQENEAQS